jgi:hypothetical protein
MHGINAFVALKRGALPAALALMGSAPKDVAVQIAGCRVISACVANPRVAARARRSPSFAGGGALRAASCALRRFGGSDGNDPSAARAAARAMWTAVHLGGRQAQAEMFLSNGALTVSPLLLAMHAHGDDASVTEACCGCLLASILDGPQSGKDSLEQLGAKTQMLGAMRFAHENGHAMRFGGAFAGLETWLEVHLL